MGRPKGSGVLKRIRADQSWHELWQTLLLGEEPVRARHAELFLQWWVGNDKGRDKRLQEFCEALRAAIAKDGVTALAALIAAVRQRSRLPAYAWQAEVVSVLGDLRLQLADGGAQISDLILAAQNRTRRFARAVIRSSRVNSMTAQ